MAVTVLLALIATLIVFAVAFDLVARRRGRYKPVSEWEAAHRRRRERQWRPRYDPTRVDRDQERRDPFSGR